MFAYLLAGLSTEFQSTPSGGKATGRVRHISANYQSFNPRLPGGRRLFAYLLAAMPAEFQSTPSGGKATSYTPYQSESRSAFQSTPSGGKATNSATGTPATRSSFNPRLPGGRRPYQRQYLGNKPLFQSTPSGGKATQHDAPDDQPRAVSIHAFRGEGDSQ